MPVYNGGEKLRRALDCLLAQTEPNFELIISDNASTDGLTRQITEEYARQDGRIRLTRQPENLGPAANFMWVLNQARGDYFLWAAHDDTWSGNYLEELAHQLDAHPSAVLATPTTCAVRQTGDSVSREFVPAAPNGDRWETLKTLLGKNICVWIYGMYRTGWLKQYGPELVSYPLHGCDRLWLYGLVLQAPVVGSTAATFTYTDAPRKRENRSTRARIEFLGIQIYHMVRLTWTHLPPSERGKGLRWVTWYLYRHQIDRRNPLGTLVRLAKLMTLGAWYATEASIRKLLARPSVS